METRLGSFAALVVLALAALVSATHGGPSWTLDDARGERSSDTTQEAGGESSPSSETPAGSDEEAGADEPPGIEVPSTAPAAILVVLLVLGAIAAVVVAVRLRLVLLRRRLTGDRPPRAGASAAPDPDPDDEEVPPVEETIDHALAELEAGVPRNAIVALWLQMERLLRTEEFAPHPAETPTEYAARARASYALDGEALNQLADLYREARFSRHPITEDHRTRARHCLTRLRAGLTERVP